MIRPSRGISLISHLVSSSRELLPYAPTPARGDCLSLISAVLPWELRHSRGAAAKKKESQHHRRKNQGAVGATAADGADRQSWQLVSSRAASRGRLRLKMLNACPL